MLIIGTELQEVSQVTVRRISAVFVNLHPKDVIMTNGIIEYDQAIAEIRGFSGAMFRAQDRLNYEHFYLRPHQSGKPGANQYTPVINGVAGWQLYHGSDYSTAVEYKFDQWMHIKIVFAAERADIYIDSDEPTLR